MARSTHLSLHIHKDPDAMAERAAHFLAEYCEEAIADHGIFTLALSGGATPIPLYRLLARSDWAERLPWEKIVVYWGDESCVPPEDPRSNYGIARRELLNHVPVTWYYRMKGERNPVEEAQAYEDMIREHFRLAPGEFPRFDCILLGLGADGHVASLFPGEHGILERERIVIDQFVHARGIDRLTMTLPVLNNARCCMFLVAGKEKHEVLSRSLNLLEEPELPAQFVRPSIGDLIWIVDEGAALGK
ncbi:MAG: 6-phosphogluconolactonase [Mailhella sp.]|nr:6-phosphogluconolactonase [Mailhella sp.]